MVEGVEIRAYWDLSELKSVKSASEAVKQFEVFLVNQFLKEAKRSMPDGLFSPKGDFASGLYYDLLYMELSQKIGEKLGENIESLFQRAIKAYGEEGGR